MILHDLVQRNRSYRRFYQDIPIETELLRQLVDLARLSASGANRQALKYFISNEPQRNAMIFPHLAWAGYLKEWGGPIEGERPAAYVIILGDRTISPAFGCDHGIAAQSMMLGATEKGLGGCMIGSVRKDDLLRELGLPDTYEILLVLALGKPKETVIIEPIPNDGNIKYWRDAEGVHHVPKRSLDEIIIS